MYIYMNLIIYNINTINSNDNNFIKFDKLVNTYSNDEIINELLDDINKKYKLLENNSKISHHDFDDKVNDIYMSKYELILAIYDIKKESLDNDKKKYIDDLINYIKNKKQNNINFYEQINILLQILL